MASKKKNAVGEATVGGKKQEYTSEISTLSAEDENLVPTSSEDAEIAETSDEGTPKTLLAASYDPKTWIEGEVIYDDDLNHAEQGIKNNSDDIASLSADLTDLQVKSGRLAAGNEIQFTGTYVLLCVGYSGANYGIYFCYGSRADQYGGGDNNSLSVTMSSGVCTFTNTHASAAMNYLAFVKP